MHIKRIKLKKISKTYLQIFCTIIITVQFNRRAPSLPKILEAWTTTFNENKLRLNPVHFFQVTLLVQQSMKAQSICTSVKNSKKTALEYFLSYIKLKEKECENNETEWSTDCQKWYIRSAIESSKDCDHEYQWNTLCSRW